MNIKPNVNANLLAEVKQLREENDKLCEDLKRTRMWIQKQVTPLRIIAHQADMVAATAEKETLDEYIGDEEECYLPNHP